MHTHLYIAFLFYLFVTLSLSIAQPLILNCSPENDLYKTMIDNGVNVIRYGSLDLAIQNAEVGNGLLVLAGVLGQQRPAGPRAGSRPC